MLSEKRIKDYVEERFEKIKQYHSDFSFFSKQTDLHQFRVEIKKVRMVTRLIDHCLGQKKSGLEFLPLKALFKEAGEIRSIYIEIGILEKYSHTGSKLIQQKEKDLRSKAKIFIQKKEQHAQVIESVEREIMSAIQNYDENDVVEYLEGLIEKTSKLLQNPDEKEKIHKARSLMKIVLYTTVLINKKIRDRLSLDTEYINVLQETIGHWHDADIALEELSSHSSISKKILKSMEDEANDLSRQVFLMSRDFIERIYYMA